MYVYIQYHLQYHLITVAIHRAAPFAGPEWVIAHVRKSCGTRTNELWHMYAWVMSRMWMRHAWSHITHMNESCPTYGDSCYTHEWVMCLVTQSQPTAQRPLMGLNSSWHTCEWVMAHTWMSHGSYMTAYESCHTVAIHRTALCAGPKWDMSHIWTPGMRHESCDTYGWVMAHIWMNYVTRMNELWRTYDWVVSSMWMSLVTRVNESYHTYQSLTSRVWLSDTTRMKKSCHTYAWVISQNTVQVQHTAQHCSTLQHTLQCTCGIITCLPWGAAAYGASATHCTTLPHHAPRCNAHCNVPAV